MKRILLLLCVLPFLFSAQNATAKNVLKEKMSVQQVLRKNLSAKKLNQVRPLAGINENLPDSVYTFRDEAKTELKSITYYTYNPEGQPTEKLLVYFSISDGVLTPDEQFKTIYTYTYKNDGKVTVEETVYEFWDDEEVFGEYEKTVNVYNLSDLVNPIEIRTYWWNSEEDDWVMEINFIAVEFDDENRPTVYEMEYTVYDEDDNEISETVRIEVNYNVNGLMSDRSFFTPSGDPDDPWELLMKEEYFYNEDLQKVKSIYTDYYNGYTSTDEYEYDERGNLSQLLVRYESEDEEDLMEEYYDNYYPEDEDEDGDGDDFAYSEAYDGIYKGDVTLKINTFALGADFLNLNISDVTLEISKGTLVFQEVPILKEGDPFTISFEDVLFNQDGNIQAPALSKDDLGLPIALIFSIIESSSAVTGNDIALTIRIMDGMGGALADIEVQFTGAKEDDEEEPTDEFAYTEAYDGIYTGDVTLNINTFALGADFLNLNISDVTLEINKGTLVFQEVPILKDGDPFTIGFEDVLFNQDGNIQAPALSRDDLGFPIALIFSIIEGSSAVTGDDITLTIQLVDGMGGALADIEILFTGKKDDGSSNETILGAEKKIIGYYNFSGQKLAREPEYGLFIILYDNGTSKKVMKLRQ